MSMRTLETAMLAEAREVLCCRKLRLKDIIEWSTSVGAMSPTRDPEIVAYLPSLQAYVATDKKHDKRPKVACEMCGDTPCKGCNKCCGSKLGRDPEDGSCLGCG